MNTVCATSLAESRRAMKVLVAPDGFKGSIDGYQAAEAIRQGLGRVSTAIEVDCLPVTDGGDGLVDILVQALGGNIVEVAVADPLGRLMQAGLGHIEATGTGIVEMARASGLVLVEESCRNPLYTTTLGTGQLIIECLERGVKHLIIGLGGSATCDGGIGVGQALGYRFLDRDGKELEPVGASLGRIAAIDSTAVDQRIFELEVEAVCDVANPLTGPRGASPVYSPQKGAGPSEVAQLNAGLANLAAVIRKEMGIDVEQVAGAGAAGGLGAGVIAFLGGKLRPGIELVLDLLDFDSRLEGVDLVITGEGRIDYQTGFDKAPAGVAAAARRAGIPCVALAGGVEDCRGELHRIGFDAVFSICRHPMSLEQAMANTPELLALAAEQVIRLFLAASDKSAAAQHVDRGG